MNLCLHLEGLLGSLEGSERGGVETSVIYPAVAALVNDLLEWGEK